MSKFKYDSYSGTDMIYKSKIVIHCSTYTYAELEEEYESGVIENPRFIEITSNESCEQTCSVEFTIPKDYLTDNFKNILSKAELVIHLGANDVLIFFKIIIPLTLSGIISGIVMVFVPALTSFAVSELLGGGKVLLIGNVIEESFMQGMQWNAGSSLSLVLMIFVLVSMTIMNRFDKDGEGTAVW